ncbi:MAG: hypothetical protein LIO74_10930 [Ruminococcus sp.]|nr:hypothetical protein [Ruminococcus sp.]
MKRNTDKTYTVSKEIEGTTYLAQFNGVREATRAYTHYKSKEIEFEEYLLAIVIVDPPGLKLDDFETISSKEQAKQQAGKNWSMCRLILSDGKFDYETVFYRMTEAEILEANAALDLMLEAQKEQAVRAKTKRRLSRRTGRR